MRPRVGRGEAFENGPTKAATLQVFRPRLARGADILKACEDKFLLALGEDRLVRDPPALLGALRPNQHDTSGARHFHLNGFAPVATRLNVLVPPDFEAFSLKRVCQFGRDLGVHSRIGEEDIGPRVLKNLIKIWRERSAVGHQSLPLQLTNLNHCG
ncbi:MAG TPA: hypothetical protein VF769_03210 [Vitreimonas sp.]